MDVVIIGSGHARWSVVVTILIVLSCLALLLLEAGTLECRCEDLDGTFGVGSRLEFTRVLSLLM